MAFVNEKISKEDYEKYNLEEVNKRFIRGNPDSGWAIDREKKRWLRKYYRDIDREGIFGELGAELSATWGFYCYGYLVVIKMKRERQRPKDYMNKNSHYGYFKILELEIPKEIENEKEQILKDLKEALEASYGGIGIYMDRKIVKSKVDLEYEGELI